MVKISKWSKQPSGSGAQNVKKPRPYKYAAQLAFLNDVFELEETMDSLTTCTSVEVEAEDDVEDSDVDEKVMKIIKLGIFFYLIIQPFL